MTDYVEATIRNAFTGVERPSDEDIPAGDIADDWELEPFYEVPLRAAPLDVPLQLAIANYDTLPLMSAKAIQFFLPVYMLAALRHPTTGAITEFVIYSLDPPEASSGRLQRFRERFSLLNEPQREAVREFLVAVTIVAPWLSKAIGPSCWRYWGDSDNGGI